MDTTEQLHVLYVDDDEEDFLLTRALLGESSRIRFNLEWSSSYAEGLAAVARRAHDVYLFDYRLGPHNGLDLLREAIDRGCDGPFILLTGCGDDNIDHEALQAGASDYLVKGQFDARQLERAIRYSVNQKRAERRVQRMAYYDALTALPNRTLFHDRLKTAVAEARRDGGGGVGLLFLDLDNFKGVNDVLGHSIGDELLKQVAVRLIRCIRHTDSVTAAPKDCGSTMGRLGGDEFVLLLTKFHHAEDVARVAKRLLGALEEPFELGGQSTTVTASIGIALCPNDGDNAETLLKNADTAMYMAKSTGKSTFRFYEPRMSVEAVSRLELDRELRAALDHQDLALHYQPQIDARSRQIIGFEALLRWQHATLGAVSPARFVCVAEQSGIIVPMGRWVLHTALADARRWRDRFGGDLRVAVNLSPLQCVAGLVPELVRALADTGVEPDALELEITESGLARDPRELADTLKGLHELGVSLALDDFGSGYFSFATLRALPIQTIKIDRALLANVETDGRQRAVVEAIIVMARVLELRTVAEGVESAAAAKILTDLGCETLQGFFFSKAVPVASIDALLARHRAASP